MHPYRVKEYLWLVILVLFAVIALAGCSSTPKVQARSEQYCDLKTQTVVVKNSQGVQSEQTVEVMKCNDNPVQRLFLAQSGMAANCGEFTYWMKLGGRDVQRKGVSCQKMDGSWEIVNTGRN